MNPNCLKEKGYGRIEGFYEPELLERKGLRSHRRVLPWKILAGIFAAFPAVMLIAVIMVGIASGTKKATNIARGSVYGMMGGIICVITVQFTLQATNNWSLSIIKGLLSWLTSSVTISTLRERVAMKKTVRHI